MNNVPHENDPLDELEERLANPPKPWDPEKRLDDEEAIRDPSVVGIIEEIDERDSGYGPFKVSIIRCRDGSRVRVAWFGTVLGQRSKNLEVGDAVGIKFLGRTQPKDKSLPPYSNFEVVRKPGNAPKPAPVLSNEEATATIEEAFEGTETVPPNDETPPEESW